MQRVANNRLDWQHLTDFALALAQASADAILPYFRQNTPVDAKPHHSFDPVTEGDRAGERAIRALIEEHFPDHGIHGEEYGVKQARSPFNWVLDPVDGTRSFICGLPTWATLIGLTYEGKPVVGVMNQPFVGETFYGNPEGAWSKHRNSTRKLAARRCEDLALATAGTVAPEIYRNEADRRGLANLTSKVRLMRYGGDAYFYCLLAAGQMDIAMDAGLQTYDIAALIPIVEGAGGAVGTWTGTNPVDGGNIICAGSKTLLDSAIAAMNG